MLRKALVGVLVALLAGCSSSGSKTERRHHMRRRAPAVRRLRALRREFTVPVIDLHASRKVRANFNHAHGLYVTKTFRKCIAGLSCIPALGLLAVDHRVQAVSAPSTTPCRT